MQLNDILTRIGSRRPVNDRPCIKSSPIDLEPQLERLKALYEQYFQGLERRPPVRLRERLDRQVRRLRRDQPNNTAMRFKYQTIFQRWITFTQYWDRISRRIEEGTYARDIRRARQRRARAERAERAEPVAEGPKSVEVELDLDTEDLALAFSADWEPLLQDGEVRQ